MLPLYFAPLQGFTNHIYRRAHHKICGGITKYYTPFIRLEGGTIRKKDEHDILPQNNEGVPVVPQIIVKSDEELIFLSHKLGELGYLEIDVNMGCPFPMQTRQGRGAGLLPCPDQVAAILHAIKTLKDFSFSLKMRLGMNDPDEIDSLLPILNNTPLAHITLHPRTASQLYTGELHMEHFAHFLNKTVHRVIFNGDICNRGQIIALEQQFPSLGGVMIGRRLLETPTLAIDYLDQKDNPKRSIESYWKIHDYIYQHVTQKLQGDSQILSHLHALWEYPSPYISKKSVKALSKCGNLKNYNLALEKAKTESLNQGR